MAPLTQSLVLRKTVCVVLGILFGLLCCWLASGETKVWGTPLMWSILWNRLLIGVLVFVAGAINYHAFLKFRIYPCLRGAACGLVVSADAAIGSLMGGYVAVAVWGTLVMGAIYGLLIDAIATKVAGEGRAVLGEWSR
ncbi:MAG: hypothetical protein JXB04_10165 [Kiritimatiellae bacterium]|nr:hypothetical protein [Kiritimatiellia bacterium]